MPHILFAGLGLIGLLFTGAAMGAAYAQMKLEDPLDDSFFQFRKRFAERVGLGGWARLERTKVIRVVGFAVTAAGFAACLAVTVWQAILAFG